MKRFSLLFAVLAATACAQASAAEESIPTPSYQNFMASCSEAATSQGLKGMELGVVGLICHCSHKQFQGKPRMSKSSLGAAGQVCERELKKDPKGFVLKYSAEAERDLGPFLK